jgi:hypothetical protein
VATDHNDIRHAALLMMTATYCNRPRTARNRRFHYENGNGQASGSGNRESWWDSSGATCIEHLRLEELGKWDDVWLGDDLVPAGCGSNHGHDNCKSWDQYRNAVLAECASDTGQKAPPNMCDEKESGDDYKSYLPSGTAPSTAQAQVKLAAEKVVRWLRP